MSKESSLKRWLATILAADIAGYSRLMGQDEAATVRDLKGHQAAILPLVARHGGRIVDTAGDGILAVFRSVNGATQCAVEIQTIMAERNKDVPENRRMVFRIGINLGDVIHDETRIYGDGINVAARLEALAEPGGVLVSQAVHDQVRDRLDLDFEDLGVRDLKNIARPVRVYRIRMSAESIPLSTPSPTLPLPDKPSIAVLPMGYFGNDTDQDYFSDGLTEDIITDLSKIAGIFVIAKNSSFAYKDKSIPPSQIARELGVRNILEGTIRRVGKRVRISTQLVDGSLNQNIWAERFDGNIEDIFDLQDQVTEKVVSALKVKLTHREKEQRTNRRSVNPEAYDLVKKADKLGLDSTFKSHLKAREIYQRALKHDPGYAPVYVGLGWTWFDEWPFGWSEDRIVLEKALRYSERALKLDPTLPGAYLLMCCTYLWMKEHDKAQSAIDRLLAFAPNSADALAFYGYIRIFSGRAEEAVTPIIQAKRIDPGRHVRFSMYLAFAYNMLERHEEAIAELEPYLDGYASYFPLQRALAYAYCQAGDLKKAKQIAAHVMKSEPGFRSEAFGKKLPFKDSTMRARFIHILKRAGFS